jgi:3-methyladenine DNA glycosylase AlkD
MILFPYEKKRLYNWAKSKNVWERRISLLATFAFIKKNQYEEILKLSEYFLGDTHDLIHKASGWMLREVGKRNKQTLTYFLETFFQRMPRTMLRYALEKYSPEERKKYLGNSIRTKKDFLLDN